MNSSTGSEGLFGAQNIGGLGYGIGVSIGVLMLITTITLASYFCARNPIAQPRRNNVITESIEPDDEYTVIEIGLDEATLKSYPKFLYSEAKINHKDSTATCCSICLADYKKKDMLRELPDCGHLFHIECVDPWLRVNPTCPVCRTSPFPTPTSTPLADGVPAATRPMQYAH